MLYHQVKDGHGFAKPLSVADWEHLLLSADCDCKDCARRRVLGPGFRRAAKEDAQSTGSSFWCEKRGWIPVTGKGLDSPPRENRFKGSEVSGVRNPLRTLENCKEVELGDEEDAVPRSGISANFNREGAKRATTPGDALGDDHTLNFKRSRRGATKSTNFSRSDVGSESVNQREGAKSPRGAGALISDNESPPRKCSRREGKRSATAVHRAVSGDDDGIPKAAVPSRERARRATATRGAQARRHKTSGLRPFVRPKFEDDKSRIKLDPETDAEENSMRIRANNLYLLGISKENSDLITANGASHLARFLEARRANTQDGDIKPEPVKVEEKAGKIVLGPQINQADELVATPHLGTEPQTPPSSSADKMGNKIVKADTEDVKKEESSPNVNNDNEKPGTSSTPWNINKAALRPHKKSSAGVPAPFGNETPRRSSSSALGSASKSSASRISSGHRVLKLHYTAGTDPLKSRKPTLFDNAYRRAMASMAASPSSSLSSAGAYGRSSPPPSGPHNTAKQQHLRAPCGNCRTTIVQTHHRGPTDYNLCALCNKNWVTDGKPSAWRGMGSAAEEEDDDHDELGDETLVAGNISSAFRDTGRRLGSWPPATPPHQESVSKKRAHEETGILGNDPPQKAHKATRTFPRHPSLSGEEHAGSPESLGLAGSNKVAQATFSAAGGSAAAGFSNAPGPCGLCKTPNPQEPIHHVLWKKHKEGQVYCHKCYMRNYTRRRKQGAVKKAVRNEAGENEESEECAQAEESMVNYENGSKFEDGVKGGGNEGLKPTVELYNTLCGRLFDLEKLEEENQAKLRVALEAKECAETKRTSDKATLASLMKEMNKIEIALYDVRLQAMDEFAAPQADYRAFVETLQDVQTAKHRAENEFLELVKSALAAQGVGKTEESLKRYQKDLEDTTRELQQVREQLKKLAGRDS